MTAADTWNAIHAFALSFPGAYEDNPWGERVAKVGDKVFVFLGRKEEAFGMSVKLPFSRTEALLMPFAKPCAYGLGKHNWITVRLAEHEAAPLEMLRRWVEESYRVVAPKKMIAQLDAPLPALARRAGASLTRRVSARADGSRRKTKKELKRKVGGQRKLKQSR